MMHSRAVQNSVLFSQHREHGFQSTWKGLKKMALHELLTVCTSAQDVETFREGFECLVRDEIAIYCSEELACYLLQNAFTKLPLDAVDNKKWHLLFKLFKQHGLKTFTTPLPSFRAIIHEILSISAMSCNVSKVARNVLLKIVTSYEIYDEDHGEHQAVIPYLTKHRGVDVNDLEESDFSSLLECLQDKLLQFCLVFSTPSTHVFLHTKLGARKINLIWTTALKNLPSNLCSGSVDVIRSFVRNGFDVTDALFSVDFSSLSIGERSFEDRVNDLLEILETFMDHGARLNPRPDCDEQPFLHGVLRIHNKFFREEATCPKLYGFITKCIQRGVDPKSSYSFGRIREDLLCVVCGYYNASDKNKLIEYLFDIGADASLCRNNGLDLWSQITYRSRYELTHPRSNETLLLLLRRGLRTGCIDRNGNNVLHKYLYLYADNKRIFERCCLLRWFRSLDYVKFWDVLDALLNTGVQISHVNNMRLIPYQLYKAIMPRSNEIGLQSICTDCFQKHMVEPLSSAYGICVRDVASIDVASIDVAPFLEATSILKTTLSTAVNIKAQLTRARELMDRLMPSSQLRT